MADGIGSQTHADVAFLNNQRFFGPQGTIFLAKYILGCTIYNSVRRESSQKPDRRNAV